MGFQWAELDATLCVVIWHHPVPRNKQGDAKMAEINFHPDDREMSTLELAKNLGIVVSVLSAVSYTHLTLPTKRIV